MFAIPKPRQLLSDTSSFLYSTLSSPLSARFLPLLSTQTYSIWTKIRLWKLLAILYIIYNLKSIPLAWHFRIFHSILFHLYVEKAPLPPDALFRPIVTRSRSILTECDYNMHKSNSTYFSDLDIARTDLVCTLLRRGIRRTSTYHMEIRDRDRRLRKQGLMAVEPIDAIPPKLGTPEFDHMETTKPLPPGQKIPPEPKITVAMGSVACVFHREIKPFVRYEIWTRILTWDRKWLYLVSHIVEADVWSRPVSQKARGWLLQPWRNVNKSKPSTHSNKSSSPPFIYASSIAKYVVKKGRLTIPPELVLLRSDLLPPKPEYAPHCSELPTLKTLQATMPQLLERSPHDDDFLAYATEELMRHIQDSPAANIETDNTYEPGDSPPESVNQWTWERVEAQRIRGLHLAEAFESLDQLRQTFAGENEGDEGVLGLYNDL